MSFIRKIKRNGNIYLAKVETTRVDGKVKQKLIEYLGKEADSNDTGRSAFPTKCDDKNTNGKPEDVKVYGSVIALDFIAKKIGLYELLGEHAHAIMTLVFCHCHKYQSVSDTVRWFKKTDLAQIFGIPEVSEKQLRNALSALEDMDHFKLQKSIFENVSTICNETPSSVVYDVTNIHFEGIHCKLAKYGKDKENVKGRLLVQIGLAITKQSGLPIFHQVHPGNVHDSKIFKEAIVVLRRYGIRNGIIVHDRGMTSKSSVLELSNTNWKLIAGVALHAGIKSAISNLDLKTLQNFRNLILQGNTIFSGIQIPYSMGSKKGKLLILLNEAKKQAKRKKKIS